MEVDIDFVELLLTSADCLPLWSDCNIAHIFLSIHVPARTEITDGKVINIILVVTPVFYINVSFILDRSDIGLVI